MSPLILHTCLAQISGIGMMVNCLFSTVFGVWRVNKGAITADEINTCSIMFRNFRLVFLWIGLIFNVARLIFESIHGDVMLIAIVFRILGVILQLVEHMYICRHYTRLVANQGGSYYSCVRCMVALACFAGLGTFSALAGINGTGTDAWEHMFWSLAMFVALMGGLLRGMFRPGGLLKHKYNTYRDALGVGAIPCILIVLTNLKSKDVMNRVVITLLYLLFTGIFHYLHKREQADELDLVVQRRNSAATDSPWSTRALRSSIRYIAGNMTTNQIADNADDNANAKLSSTVTTYPFSPANDALKGPATTISAGNGTSVSSTLSPSGVASNTYDPTTQVNRRSTHSHAVHDNQLAINCVDQLLPFDSHASRKPSGINSGVSMTNLLLRFSSRFPASSTTILPTERESLQPDLMSQKEPGTGVSPPVVASIHQEALIDPPSLLAEAIDTSTSTALTDAARKRLLNTILVDKVFIITGQVCTWYVFQFIVELCIIAYYNVNFGSPPNMCPTFVLSGSPDPLAVLQTVFDMVT